MGNLIKELKNIPSKYKSIPFWSWNSKLEPEEVARQIKVLRSRLDANYKFNPVK